MNRAQKLLAGLAVALALPAFAAGCGGDDDEGGDEDPAALLEAAMSTDTEYDSGVLNLALSGSLEGTQSGSLEATISGPFSRGEEGQAPELALDASASVTAEGLAQVPGGSVSFDFDGGFALADDSLFVTYQDTTYEASEDLYSEIAPIFEAASSAGEAAAEAEEGSDSLVDSLTNLENEGTEEINGESVQHVSGDLDVNSLVERSGDAVPLDASQLEGVTGSVDAFISEADDTLRQIDFAFAADGVEALAPAGIDGLDFTFSLGIAEPNSEQTIEAPTDTQPLDSLLEQFGSSEAEIQRLFQGSFAISPGGLPGITPEGGVDGGAEDVPGASTDDLETQLGECLQQAGQDQAALQECLE